MGPFPKIGTFVTRSYRAAPLLVLFGLSSAVPASAQVFEAVGSRALGMGGAFVAVADDSSAVWWNPAGLAPGPFLDLALGGASADIASEPASHRERSLWFTVTTPVLGFSYYRLRINDIARFQTTTEPGSPGREDGGVDAPGRSLSASQFGGTFVQTLVSGVHAGTTLKYVRVEGKPGPMDAQGGFDLDVGVIAIRGPVRLGGVVRNVLETEFDGVRLPRQARAGVGFDVAEAGGPPVMLAVDADVGSYQTFFGSRRVVAFGGEGWAFGRRVGVRAGARFNTVGAEEKAMTAGASVALRSGLYVDGHLVRGGARDERGWGVAARVSF